MTLLMEPRENDMMDYLRSISPLMVPLIRSLAISSTHRRDFFCWNFIKNGQYTVKSGYWIARNLMSADEEMEVVESSIANLQAFGWKVKARQKICHPMWQLLT